MFFLSDNGIWGLNRILRCKHRIWHFFNTTGFTGDCYLLARVCLFVCLQVQYLPTDAHVGSRLLFLQVGVESNRTCMSAVSLETPPVQNPV